MTIALHGCKVLVTRPRQQGENLCRLIQRAGGQAIPFPVITAIAAAQSRTEPVQALIATSSVIIFISRNAVIFTDQLVEDLAATIQGKAVYAVGEGTLQELTSKGILQAKSPGPQSGSEALLALTDFAPDNIRGRQILIMRGQGGRERLKEVLQANGAQVRYAEVYQRLLPEITAQQLETLWQDTGPDVIVVTSNQGLQNLLELCGDKYRQMLCSRRLVVISARQQVLAHKAGFKFPAIVAPEQTDQGLLLAIEQSVELMRNEC